MKAFRVSSMVALAVAAALSGCAATQDAAHSAVSGVKSLAGQAQVTRQAVAPALYEVAYESNNRPDWVHIPLQAVKRILGE